MAASGRFETLVGTFPSLGQLAPGGSLRPELKHSVLAIGYYYLVLTSENFAPSDARTRFHV